MAYKADKSHGRFAESEIGTIRKDWRGRVKVALVYPNRYHVGMSNLGFQTVYHQLNEIEHVVCERSFMPEDIDLISGRVTTVESGRPVSDFDIVAFSISFENDYLNLLTILQKAGIPLLAGNRENPHPIVMAGGVACSLNPEPIALFIDCFFIGEVETMLPRFFDIFSPGLLDAGRRSCLKQLAGNVPGIYVPAFYKTAYNADGTISSFKPVCDVPDRVKRVYLKDLSQTETCSAILTPHTTFARTFLIEVGRGCPHGCRFCSAGYIYRPPRFRPLSLLEKNLEQGLMVTDKIGLVGAAVSDLPDIKKLCAQAHQKGSKVSFSSLRADAIDPEFVSVLKQSRVKTATIAPDAGSERMRRVINKGVTEDDVLNAVNYLVSGAIPNIKLYFMVGLPTETMDDVEAVVKLCKQVKNEFLKASRLIKRIGKITVSINSFVPKPFTPFQWVAMDSIPILKQKIKLIKNGLKGVANVRVHADIPRWAYIHALLSRGDRKVSQVLSLANRNKGNWAQTLKATSVSLDSYIYRERCFDEILPWDFIDHGIKKSFLKQEYYMAMQSKTSPICPMRSCDLCGVCKRD